MKKLTVEQAWEQFFASRTLSSLEDLKADGWRTRKEVRDAVGGMSTCAVEIPGLVSELFRVRSTSGIRKIRLYRPSGV